jgi:TRAP-type C4-dicarboxylate transport system permease small subunit
MQKLIDGFFHLMKIAAALCLAVMVVLVFTNVVLRYAFNEGIAVSEELSCWAMVYVTYIAGLTALREHGHLGFDGVVARMPDFWKKVCLVLAHVLMIGATGMFLVGAWQQTLINLDSRAAASGISQGWLYGIGVFFSIGAIVVLGNDLYRALTGKLGAKELVMVESEGGEANAEIEKALQSESATKAR